ncbi:MAG: citrate/2-methylcitrate synthase [Planctomycetota bacterium]
MKTTAHGRHGPAHVPIAQVGLDGVIAGVTRLSEVEGEAGRLTIAGFPAEVLAPRASFEETLHLLWEDRLPTSAELDRLNRDLREKREPGELVRTLLVEAAARGAEPMDALRLGVAALAIDSPGREAIVASMPVMLANFWRCRTGRSWLDAPHGGTHAECFLELLFDRVPEPAERRALDTYWNTVADHGMNASTFTARVIASTGSDQVAAVEGALGALKGPLHGGAPGPALATLQALRAQGLETDGGDLDARTRAHVREVVVSGERMMGFGHRVYRVRDPRADILGAEATRLLGESDPLWRDARVFETAVLEVLAELKPDRAIHTNVEFYTALLLHGLGLDARLFSSVFALARVGGWLGHFDEQTKNGRLLRPRAAYRGARDRAWVPIAERVGMSGSADPASPPAP